jgi:hypothetical protein
MKYKQNDAVEIHSLGSLYGDKTFPGRICGIAVNAGDSPATIWIVECPELASKQFCAFTHLTMPQACLRPLQTWPK